MIYLASPYTHEDPAVMQHRFELACDACAYLLSNGEYVYSPIVHTHPIAIRNDLPRPFEFWQGFDQHMIDRCTAFWVLKIDGWDKSVGIAAEKEYYGRHGAQPFHIEWPVLPGSWLDREITGRRAEDSE